MSLRVMGVLAVLPFSLFASLNLQTEARVAYVYPISEDVRDIYGSAAVQYQVETSYRFYKGWSIWANGGFQSQSGKSTGFDTNTRLQLYPVSVGGQYHWTLPWRFEVYLAGGPTCSFVYIKDNSPYVQKYMSQGAFGGIAKTGLIYRFCPHLYVDAFFSAYYTKFHFSGTKNNVIRNDLNMSSLLCGAGLGFAF